MKSDYLIIGQGLAGTTLAHQLLRLDKSITIIQNSTAPSSSKVAGGMINPITGKRLAKTWLMTELFSYLQKFYQSLEKELEAEFLFDIPLCRPFKNDNQKSQFIKAVEKKELQDLVEILEEDTELAKKVANPLGGLLVSKCGRLDLPLFLEKSVEYFEKKGILTESMFSHEELNLENDFVLYKGDKYRAIVFCEGTYVKNNPLFSWLPFNPVKGETLDVRISDNLPKMIFNQGAWMMPIADKVWKLGSTYDWDNLDFEPSENARKQILEKVGSFLKVENVEILKQSAGVRPAVIDRRPILGAHPNYENVFIFNGLGTKGVSLAPYFSEQLARHLVFGKEINKESTIERFYALL